MPEEVVHANLPDDEDGVMIFGWNGDVYLVVESKAGKLLYARSGDIGWSEFKME